MSNIPDYYDILDISKNAKQSEIPSAYKRQALLYHPDRLPKNSSEKEIADATKRFQLIGKAYEILGDASRRESYDKLRNKKSRLTSQDLIIISSTSDADETFGIECEEEIKQEMENNSYLWKILGSVSGALLGFICGDEIGAVAGAAAGGLLGNVRDVKGKSVYKAFQELPADDKRKILNAMLKVCVKVTAAGLLEQK